MGKKQDIFEKWKEERNAQPWYKRISNNIRLWWMFDGKFIIRNIREGFKNIWYWLPIIWKDRHWDHGYIYDILSHKLKAQAHRLLTADMYIGVERDVEIINTCIRLIEKVKTEYYSIEPMDYEKVITTFEPIDIKGFNELKIEELSNNRQEYFQKYPLVYEKCLAGKGVWGKLRVERGTFDPKDEQFIAMDMAHTNQQRAHDLLFKLLSENINKWWD